MSEPCQAGALFNALASVIPELTDLQRNSQPPVASVSKCAHFQLASLLLICNLAESARCYASLAGRSNGPSLCAPQVVA